MTTQDSTGLFARLAGVIRDVFNCPDLDVTRDTTSLDVDGWDSLSHTTLLLRIESTFGVRLPLDRAREVATVGDLADLLEPLVVPAPTAAQRHDTHTVILHGNCQMHDVAHHLWPVMAGTGYEIVYIASFNNWTFKLQPEPGEIARCAVFIEQVAPVSMRKGLPATFKGELPAGCRHLRVPALWMKSLWPFHHLDPRNEAIKGPEAPSGKHPFGDSLVTRLLAESSDPEVVFRRYMETDIRTVIDLDRFHEMVMADAYAADRGADLAFAPMMEREFRVRRLFDAVNHPSYELIIQLRDLLAQFILDGAAVLPDVPRWIPLTQVPLHPQVIEHFTLAWTSPGDTHLYFQQPLTFTEYLRKLIAFE